MEDVKRWFAELDDCKERDAIGDLSALTYRIIRKLIEERESRQPTNQVERLVERSPAARGSLSS